MPTITYDFEVGSTVWVVLTSGGVHQAIVSQINIQQVFPAVAPTVQYTVSYLPPVPSSGTSGVVNADMVFGDVDSALNNYRCQITDQC